MKQTSYIISSLFLQRTSIFILWLFIVSAIVGMSLNHRDWFLSKTPLNLIISLVVLAIPYFISHQNKLETEKIYSKNLVPFALFVYIVSMIVEWHGVKYGILFGPYKYLTNLGPKVQGVPWIIGANWTMIVFSSASICGYLHIPTWAKVLVGSLLMVALDILIELKAPSFDFWVFDGGMPGLRNYISWFICGLLFHSIWYTLGLQSHRQVGVHIYISQVVFFTYFILFDAL